MGTNGWITVYTANTSSRILVIGDVRAVGFSYGGATVATYSFAYDHQDYVIPHLTSFGNEVGTSERGGPFTYTSVTQEPPFGTDANYGSAVQLLTTVPLGPLQPYHFAYDTAGAGELASVIFPYGGEISWNYDSFQYIGSRTLREVGGRFVAPDALHATNPPWSYGISRPDAANSVTAHSAMTLTDASGIGAKTWTFNTGGAAWQIGLASRYTQLASVGGAILHDDYYTWSQDPAGHPYISADTSISDEGTGNQQSALSTQTLDQYGNMTQSVIYPYNNTTTPLKTYNNTYITSSNYTSSYIYNLLSTSTLTMGGTNTTLVTNYYDSTACKAGPFGGSACGGNAGGTVPTAEYDAISPVPAGYKGILAVSVTPAKATGTYYYSYGGVSSVAATDGTTATASASAGTNYAAPQSISVQNYSQTVSYNAWLGMTSQTGANGEQLSMTYDSNGRPSAGTSPYGAVTGYSYGTTAPFAQTEYGPSGVTITTVDGFGRPVLVQRGHSTSPDSTTSYSATVYAPCACSPLGKQSQASQPYPSGSPSAWTTWSYDGLGRTVSVQQPDGASTTHYAYSGNQTTVTDPAGKWKQFTKDVLGNFTTVVEPDPANQPGGTLTTSYTYDWMGHVTQVSMPRGSTTQTRTFVYDVGGRLTSATNPENGTVTYTYNVTNTLNTKVDAKGQAALYTYDSQNRVLKIQRYPQGVNNAEDTCARVTYTYDTNPVSSSFSQYSQGRLTTAQYYGQNVNTSPGYCSPGYSDTYTEMYSYHRAGAVTAKNVQMARAIYSSYYGEWVQGTTNSLEVDYSYDQVGRTASVTYPFRTGAPHTFSYGYDSMGRPTSLTDSQDDTGAGVPTAMMQNVQYDFAGRLTSLQQYEGVDNVYSSAYINDYAQETRTYNVNGQLASQSWGMCETNCYTYGAGIQYTYSATQNNGQIAQAVDAISGETIAYQYDALKRLTSAGSTPKNGSYPAAWTETFQYDGFGNLTAKVLNGTTTPIAVNAATNRLTNAYYDANGNMTSGAGGTFTFDEANRISSVTETSGGQEFYGYDAANKRIYVRDTNQSELFTFYGAKGEKLGVYSIAGPLEGQGNCPYTCIFSFGMETSTVWFAGKMIWDSNGAVIQDRLGSNRGSGDYYYGFPGMTRFYPYGDDITSTSNDRVKFATYLRDSYTGLDYADQRFYASTYGRFNTPDPYMASAKGAKNPGDPGSWNHYSYTGGDPVNRKDPTGLLWELVCSSGDGFDDPGCGSGGVTDPLCGNLLDGVPEPGCYTVPIVEKPVQLQPTCSIDLFTRGAPFGASPAQHTYIDATVDYDNVDTTIIFEGGPTPQGSPLGFLTGYISTTGVGSLPGTNPNSPTNHQIGTAYAGANACSDITQLENDVNTFNKGSKVLYNALPGVLLGGYNSNSFTFTLLYDIGLLSYFPSPRLLTPGWGFRVPGL
jgi:RHS repeat-associated protein